MNSFYGIDTGGSVLDCDTTQSILQYLTPKDLHNVATTSKRALASLTHEDVAFTCLYHGGNSLKSIERLYTRSKSMSIHTLLPIEVLRMCISRVCGFCKRNPNNRFGPGKTNAVRPNFAVHTCQGCLVKRFRSDIWLFLHGFPKRLATTSLTSAFMRVKYSDSKRLYFVNQYYEAHKDAILAIFNHVRVLAYPYGKRLFELIGNEYVPVLTMDNDTSSRDIIESKDAYEVTWARPTYNSFGLKCGPIFDRSLLSSMVDYYESPDYKGLDYFFDHLLPGCPKADDYKPFVEAYEKYSQDALQKNEDKKDNIRNERQLARYNMIEVAVKAIAKIAKCLTPSILGVWSRQLRNQTSDPSQSYCVRISKIYRRALLLYHEIPYVGAKWCLTYDTGIPMLDRLLHDTLGRYLMNPHSMTRHEAIGFAHLVYTKCRRAFANELSIPAVNGIFLNRRRSIATTFGMHYRREYSRRESRVWPSWTDTSNHRRL